MQTYLTINLILMLIFVNAIRYRKLSNMYLLVAGDLYQRERTWWREWKTSGLTGAGLKGALECGGSGQGRKEWWRKKKINLAIWTLLSLLTPGDGSNATPSMPTTVKPHRRRRRSDTVGGGMHLFFYDVWALPINTTKKSIDFSVRKRSCLS